jgi:hypothetical protein
MPDGGEAGIMAERDRLVDLDLDLFRVRFLIHDPSQVRMSLPLCGETA